MTRQKASTPRANVALDAETRVTADHHLSLRVWLRMLACTNLIGNHVRQKFQAQFDTTLPRFDLMAQLERAPQGLKMGELTRRLMVTGGNVTGITDMLEAEGLVTRATDPEDQRAFRVKLTKAGEQLFRRMAAEHERCGGPGVGVVGMCFTGGFALAMMVDDVVLAPVLSQPSQPFPLSKKFKADVGISEADLARVKERTARGTCVLGLRFTNDFACQSERFETLRRELGDAFIAVEIDSASGNPYGHPKQAHSVLTEHLDDRPGTPTRAALDQVLNFFKERLEVG